MIEYIKKNLFLIAKYIFELTGANIEGYLKGNDA